MTRQFLTFLLFNRLHCAFRNPLLIFILSCSISVLILNYLFVYQEIVVKHNLLRFVYLHYANDRRERSLRRLPIRAALPLSQDAFSFRQSTRRARRPRRFESILRRVNYFCACSFYNPLEP